MGGQSSKINIRYIMTTPTKGAIFQFLKFGVVGILNTLVDLGIFNILIFLFGLNVKGSSYILFKGVSFSAAVINSYILNRHFVFNDSADIVFLKKTPKKEFTIFFIISVVGLLLNVSISSFAFYLGSIADIPINHYVLANIGAITGSITVLVWNFIGYKFFVFKKQK